VVAALSGDDMSEDEEAGRPNQGSSPAAKRSRSAGKGEFQRFRYSGSGSHHGLNGPGGGPEGIDSRCQQQQAHTQPAFQHGLAEARCNRGNTNYTKQW
jgi:hypothetical protein